jgi:uncharacterized protein HemX
MAPTYIRLSAREDVEEPRGGAEPESESSSSGTKYTVIGLAVLLVLAVGIGAFLYIQKRTKKARELVAKVTTSRGGNGVASGKTHTAYAVAGAVHGMIKNKAGKR